MKRNRSLGRLGASLLVIGLTSLLVSSARASGKYKTLHTFKPAKTDFRPKLV